MNKCTLLNSFKRNKKKHERFILFLLLFILLITYMTIFLTSGSADQGPKRAVGCMTCNFREIRNVKDISSCRCPHCNKPMGYIMKCVDCDFEFPFIDKIYKTPATIEEARTLFATYHRCPTCDSTQIRHISRQKMTLAATK